MKFAHALLLAYLTLLLKNGRSVDLYLPPEAKNARVLINEISARTGVTD